MSVSFENKETNRGVLTFTISQDQIKPELDRVFKSVKKSLNVPGFRKGHLPRPIFDKKFGEESLYQDVMNALLPNAYEAAVKEAGLEVVAQPKIDVTSMEKGQDWVIAAEVVTPLVAQAVMINRDSPSKLVNFSFFFTPISFPVNL
ncbi:hypothetical protein K6Y81_41050 [Burkholderia cenocepacia]|nr:hypothetical protein [Burkholderia cenocepacia]